MIKLAVFLAAALSAAVPAWAVNKCTGPDGKVMFQDAPCPGTGITVAEDLARRQAETELRRNEANKLREEAEIQKRKAALQDEARQALRQQVCKGKFYAEPTIGMKVETWQHCTEFWDSHGSGEKVNETESAAGVRRQHVFRYSTIKYIYTTNGIITAIQR